MSKEAWITFASSALTVAVVWTGFRSDSGVFFDVFVGFLSVMAASVLLSNSIRKFYSSTLDQH